MTGAGRRDLGAALSALLDGLADAVPAERYGELVDAVVAAVPGGRAEVTIATRRAYESLQYRRIREGQLSALYDTVRDLVAVRDVEGILAAVVDRARRVLPGADTTYLCLRDESTGGFYVLADIGLISPAFKNVKVPPGHGMSAEIERTRAAVRVRRYQDSPEFRHDPGLDRALAADGLASVLGAPLIARGEVLGILFAANRRERPFSDDETALLTALAGSAALAIDNAYQFAQAEAARRRLDTDNAALRASADLHARLTELVARAADAGEVPAALGNGFGTIRLTLDEGGPAGAPDDRGLAEALARSRDTGRPVLLPDAEHPRRFIGAIRSGDNNLGTLSAERPEPFTVLEIRDLERAAQIVALLALRRTAVAEAEERIRGELLIEMFTAPAPLSADTRRRARARGLDLDRPLVVAALRTGDAGGFFGRREVLATVAEEGGIAGELAGVLAVVVPGDDSAGYAAKLHARIRRANGGSVLVCAAALTGTDGDGFAGAFRAARAGLDLLTTLGRSDGHASAESLLLYQALFSGEHTGRLRSFIADTIGPMLAYDRENHGDLEATLSAYLGSGDNVTRTARQLYVHPNTVKKRLDRLTVLLGADWQREPANLAIRVALRLHRLAQPAE